MSVMSHGRLTNSTTLHGNDNSPKTSDTPAIALGACGTDGRTGSSPCAGRWGLIRISPGSFLREDVEGDGRAFAATRGRSRSGTVVVLPHSGQAANRPMSSPRACNCRPHSHQKRIMCLVLDV